MNPTRRAFLFVRSAFLSALLLIGGCGQLPSAKAPGCPTPAPFGTKNLSEYSTEELLGYLTLDSINWHYTNMNEVEVDWSIAYELLERPEDLSLLVEAFADPVDTFQQEYVAWVLRQSDDPAVLEAFRKHPTDAQDRVTWYCLQYRAERGDMDALRILNEHYRDYPVASHEWAETAVLFGDFGYTPAILKLIESLDAAFLNLAAPPAPASNNSSPAHIPTSMAPAPPNATSKNGKKNRSLRRVDEGSDAFLSKLFQSFPHGSRAGTWAV